MDFLFVVRALFRQGPTLRDAKRILAWHGGVMRLLHAVLATAVFVATSSVDLGIRAEPAGPTSDIGDKVPGAERIEGRLLAPCCWAQTLDIHGSEIANSLRREIRTRLKAGESPDAIEQSLVARYGERMRAVPDRVPLEKMGEFGWLGVAATAGFLGFVMWQWRKRGISSSTKIDPGTTSAAEPSSNEASDERLEAELHRIDDT